MAGCIDVQPMLPKSEHSEWDASSSNFGLASLAARLRSVPGSADYSQDGAYCTY